MKRNIYSYMSGMYRNISGVLLLSASMLAGCGDYLEVEPQNVITLEKFWNEEKDVENVVAGCYNEMLSYNIISRMLVWGEFRSENIVAYGMNIEKDVDLERILKENITANNVYTRWTAFYDIINRCNLTIKYAPRVALNDPSYNESELNAHIAEVTALRSLCYFYLIRAFQDVPYSEEPFMDDNQTLDLEPMSFNEILTRLINSLEEVKNFAINKYPQGSGLSSYYNTGRITRNAIYAMLCEMYLWNNDYANCIRYADLIIEAKKADAREKDATTDYSDFNNYPLISSRYLGASNAYGRAFNQIFVRGNSSESIFELNFEKGSDGSQASNGPVSNFYGNSGRSPFCKASDYVGDDISRTKPSVFTNKYDGRAYENMRFSSSGEAVSINKYACGSEIELTDPNSTYFFSAGIWGSLYPTFGADYESRNKSNFILYRLTDIMLLKAEALSQQISDAAVLTESDLVLRDEAFSLVNAVNKRSIYQATLKDTLLLANYATKKDLTDLVFDERARELMFEGKRYFDLVRRARRENDPSCVSSKAKLKSSDNASMIENQYQKLDRIYWPYNLAETKVNKNLKQNSAFSSGENSSYTNTTTSK